MSNSLNTIISVLPARFNIHSYFDYYERIKHLFAINASNTRRQALAMFKAMPAGDKIHFFNECGLSEELQEFLIQQTEGTEL